MGVKVITGLSHASIVVPSLADAAREMNARARLKIGKIEVNEQQGVRLAYVNLGNAKIELMEPSRADSPVAKFLERNPRGGIHHFCLAVDNVDAASANFKAAGVRVLGDDETNVHGEADRVRTSGRTFSARCVGTGRTFASSARRERLCLAHWSPSESKVH